MVGKTKKKVADLWPHMIMLDPLITHFEHTGDDRIIPLMAKFFRWCLALPDDMFIPNYDVWAEHDTWYPCIQYPRAGDMLPHIYWLFNRTGEANLLDLAARFHSRVPSPPRDRWLMEHVVHFTQRFREPGIFYQQSRNPKDLEETEYWYHMHMATWGQQPGGIFAADENIRPGKTDPKQGFETCAMVEFNKSFYLLGQITGQALYADRVEDITFNSFPASSTPDLKGLHYLTAGNQPQLDNSENHDYQNRGRQIDYSPHMYRCCQHDVAMGWPWLVEHLWMATTDTGLAAWIYGPCRVTAKVGTGTMVTIHERTEYPFSDRIEFTVEPSASVEFPLYLRVPKWCREFQVAVNGKSQSVSAAPQQYVVIDRTWENGDTVELRLPMELSITEWTKSANSVTVNRGPLSYSLRIGEQWRRCGGTNEWPEWEVRPTTPWNYGLEIDRTHPEKSLVVNDKGRVPDQPWRLDNAPIEIHAKGGRIPNWTLVDETVTDLQPSPIRSDQPAEDITLIPMGCARLRMSCLPTIGTGPNAHEWVRVSCHTKPTK